MSYAHAAHGLAVAHVHASMAHVAMVHAAVIHSAVVHELTENWESLLNSEASIGCIRFE